MANFTKVESYEQIQAVACTSSFHGEHFLFLLAVMNILLSVSALGGNILIFVALQRETSIHPPSKLLFQCLTATDLSVGVFSQPMFAVQLISIAHQRLSLCYTVVGLNEIVGTSLSGVSLFTLTAITIDRLLALLLGLRYRQTVTLRRMRAVVISLWILNISFGCLRRFWEHAIMSKMISAIIYFLIAISVISYMKIYLTLRGQRNKIEERDRRGHRKGRAIPSLNIARYRKTVCTAVWVQVTLLACYFPYGIAAGVGSSMGHSPSNNLAARLAITLVYLNSCLNPILYCWKIRGVRKAAKDTILKICRLN